MSTTHKKVGTTRILLKTWEEGGIPSSEKYFPPYKMQQFRTKFCRYKLSFHIWYWKVINLWSKEDINTVFAVGLSVFVDEISKVVSRLTNHKCGGKPVFMGNFSDLEHDFSLVIAIFNLNYSHYSLFFRWLRKFWIRWIRNPLHTLKTEMAPALS